MNNPFEEIISKLNGIELAISRSKPDTVIQSEIISRDELCRRLSISEPTAIRWERRGRIPSFRIGTSVRFNWPKVVSALETSKSKAK